MRLRSALLGAGFLALPFAAQAQTDQLGYPITGFYFGAAGGFTIKGAESVKNISASRAIGSGFSTPNLTVNSSIGGTGIVDIGYGFGNGLRAEIEGDYLGNSINSASGSSPAGYGVTTGAKGSEQVAGVMVNLLYDFVGLTPMVVPYVGVGAGYQWARLSGFTVTGSGAAGFLNPVVTASNTGEGAPAVQGIIGAAFPVPQFPGLALTVDYRIMAMFGTRTYPASLAVVGPTGAVRRGFGSFQLGHEYNNSFLFGVRYNFGVTPPPPPPAPAPIAAPAPAPARSYLVFFDWDKATLTDRARQIIREAAENSTRIQYTVIEVNGYTDTSGSPAYNLRLSVRRAENVAAELVRDGVPRNVISIHGFGETHLLVPTGPGVREPQNRRVEIIIR